jgi:transposase
MGMILFTPHTKKTGNYVWIKKKSVKKEDILKMLHDLKKVYRRKKLILLWDGLAAHKAKIVKAFVEGNTSWLTVERFPAYAPELNPQEYEWSSLKRKYLGNYCPPSMEHLERKARAGITKMKQDSKLLKGFLKKSGLWGMKELGEEQ